MNRCPRLDRLFPYEMPGWSVDVWDGQYRASRMRGDEQDLRQGKEGWFGQEGQPPGPSVTVTRLTQVGVIIPAWKRPKDDTHGPRWTPDAHGFPFLGSLTPAEKDRHDHAVPDRASAVVEKIQTWTRSGAQSGMGAIRLLWGAL